MMTEIYNRFALCVSPTRFARFHSQPPVPSHVCRLPRAGSRAQMGSSMPGMLVESRTRRTAILYEMRGTRSGD